MTQDFTYLNTLIRAYFNQDYQLMGETIEEVFATYLESNVSDDVTGLRADIERFLVEYKESLDEAFEKRYGYDFDPKLWDLTTESFLRKLLGLMDANHGLPQ